MRYRHNKNNINNNNIDMDKQFAKYIKSNFKGLSPYTLQQVIADFMKNGWDCEYCFDCDDDYWRYHHVKTFVENPTVTMIIEIPVINQPVFPDANFHRVASFLVQEELFIAFTKRNNYDLVDMIEDIVNNCPYL